MNPVADATQPHLVGISSMAARLLLQDLALDWGKQQAVSMPVVFEAVGGLDAAARVAAGESFDLVVLAADAIAQLVASGHVQGASVTPLALSHVAVAVRQGAPRPDISSQEALRQAVLAAPRVGFSTGPSGVAVVRMFERWGISDTLRGRMVQAPPGKPVASLLAAGEVELGFQQLSELMHAPGISLLGTLPATVQISTQFVAAQCSTSTQGPAVRQLLDFLRSDAAGAAKLQHGMVPA